MVCNDLTKAELLASVTHLYNLGVIEPLTEYSLYESKHLLQNHNHLKKQKKC